MSPKRRENTGPQLTEGQGIELRGNPLAWWGEDSAFDSETERREAWREHREELVEEYRQEHPGKRPEAWWQYEAPRDRPVVAEDRPEGAPRDLPNEAAWLLEFGALTEEERRRCGPPNPAEREAMKTEKRRFSDDFGGLGPIPRRDVDPDFSACLAALPAGDRAAVKRWCRLLGVPEDRWHRVPPLRSIVVHMAVLELADLEGASNKGDAIDAAARAVGLPDDPSRATRPSASLYRQLRRWRRRGQNVHTPDSDAA